MPSLAKGYDDPRVTVKIMDGAKLLEENLGAFDVIITDSSDRKEQWNLSSILKVV